MELFKYWKFHWPEKLESHLNNIDLNMKMQKQCWWTINLQEGDTKNDMNRPDNSRCQNPFRSRFHAELSNNGMSHATWRWLYAGWYKQKAYLVFASSIHKYSLIHDEFHFIHFVFMICSERTVNEKSEVIRKKDKLFCRNLSVCCVKLIEWIW